MTESNKACIIIKTIYNTVLFQWSLSLCEPNQKVLDWICKN